MDPNSSIKDLLEAMAVDEPDKEYILERLKELYNWINCGGFVPQISMYRNSNDPSEKLYYIVK